MINRLKRPSALGFPWHGRASNGTLSTLSDGDKTITDRESWMPQGLALPVRSPVAPGVVRNTAQAAQDAALGHAYRDYSLLCGPRRSVNGGAELGMHAWVYADASGANWVVRLDAVKNGGAIDLTLTLSAVFGRLPAPAFTPRTLATLSWSPVLRSGYTGSTTVADVVASIDLNDEGMTAPAIDGARCLVNFRCTDDAIATELYRETTPAGSFGGVNTYRSLVGTVDITLSGIGDLASDGAGIAATMINDLDFNGLVSYAFDTDQIIEAGGIGGWEDISSGFPRPSDPTLGDQHTVVDAWQTSIIPPADHSNTNEYDYTAILYRAPHGDVTRRVENADNFLRTRVLGGGYSVTYNEEYTGAIGDGWDTLSCNGTSDTHIIETETDTVRRVETYNIFGHVIAWTRDKQMITQTVNHIEPPTPHMHTELCSNIDSSGVPNPAPDSGHNRINGVDITVPGEPGFETEIRIYSQNCVWLGGYMSHADDFGLKDFDEAVIIVDNAGGASAAWSGTRVETYSGPFGLPPDRQLRIAYDPGNGAIWTGQQTLGVAYTAPRWQYV